MMNDSPTPHAEPLVESDEAALLAGLRAGDPVHFESLVRVFSARLLAVARRLLRNEEDARDAVQDAFISALGAIQRFDGSARLYTWLYRIAVNASLMKLRSQRRHPTRSIEELLPAFATDGHRLATRPDWSEAADASLERKETSALVRRFIDQLPEEYRTVLLLRDIEEMSTEETARMLDLTQGAVKTRLHRARQALREMLDRYFEGSAP